ncbi:MAG: hypothetical protein HC764_14265 [Pleurocapsa sp. CRU_1_2]|nr:hypothetical protein [Pleurocapsa sp. CRU_1_2]
MGQALARKAQYDLEIINARSCAELISAGISLNSEKFPTLSVVCDGVSLVENNINQSKSSVQLEPQNSPSLNKNDDEESNNLNKIESTRLRDDETDENNEYF